VRRQARRPATTKLPVTLRDVEAEQCQERAGIDINPAAKTQTAPERCGVWTFSALRAKQKRKRGAVRQRYRDNMRFNRAGAQRVLSLLGRTIFLGKSHEGPSSPRLRAGRFAIGGAAGAAVPVAPDQHHRAVSPPGGLDRHRGAHHWRKRMRPDPSGSRSSSKMSAARAAASGGSAASPAPAPDGYTIDIGQWDTHVGSIIYKLNYDLEKRLRADRPDLGEPTVARGRKRTWPPIRSTELVAPDEEGPGQDHVS